MHVLVIRGDGTRVVTVDLSRATLRIAAGGLVAAVAMWSAGLATRVPPPSRVVVASVATAASVASAPPPVAPAPATDAAPRTPDTKILSRRLAEMRAEVVRWRALHAQIWAPLGADGQRRATGVGGGTATAAASTGSVEDQVAELSGSLVEERQRLHALASFIASRAAVLRAMPVRWPVRGSVNSEFGRRLSPWTGESEFHGGIDIAASSGTPVKAPAAGRVVFAGQSPGYGLTVIVEHVRDVKTLFGHLKDVSVSVGQHVEAGQLIARSGESGRTTGPHLHYEVTVRGQPVDPRGYLWD